MIMTDQQIRQAIDKGEIVIDPFDDDQVQPASIDLRVGDEGATIKNKRRVNIKELGVLILEPGDFGVVSVLERIKLGPQFAGRIGLRSKYARKGLIATTGPQIDPGFEGGLTLGLANLTPRAVSIGHKDDILTLEIHRLAEPVKKPYTGPYQNRYGLGPDDLEAIAEGDGMAFSEVLTTLRSLSTNVADLTSQMKTMQWVIPAVLGVGLAIIAIISAFK
jgi:dCTP deaminase